MNDVRQPLGAASVSLAAILVFRAALAAATAADVPVAAEPIPASSQRPVVVQLEPAEARVRAAKVPRAHLPDGYAFSVAAASPLVTHPIAGCLDDRGRLFLGDAVGVNWKKAELEANPPNRVLMLEDTDRDGSFDKSTIFADKMTFPQGAQWLDGSLYVASPPGIWKLTDTDNDGMADQREMIVGGFDYTGNAADVHGPFLHPNGRLYWCHGRKGFRVTGKDGRVLHEGASSGIWSAKPDGSDVQWHSLLAGDNPVEIDFTPQGDIIGVQNLYYSQPRGDTIMHWLYGGVYERADQMKVIAGRPRTLEKMPVMYDFGHVAVSGSCFWKSFRQDEKAPLHFLVTHFNTQRVVRMELTPHGSTYEARENEFLKLEDPDVHFTDVMEDADGSLLVLDTGGWFRIGCPASLMAKPDTLGAIYRVRRTAAAPAGKGPWQTAFQPPGASTPELLAGLSNNDPQVRLRTLSHIAETDPRDPAIDAALLAMMGEKNLDAPLEHALLFAARKCGAVRSVEPLRAAPSPLALRRMLVSFSAGDADAVKESMALARQHLDAPDDSLARVALKMVVEQSEIDGAVVQTLQGWLAEPAVPAARLQAVQRFCAALLAKEEAQRLITAMLEHPSAPVRRTALETLAKQNPGVSHPAWIPIFQKSLAEARGPTPLLLDALKKVKAPGLDAPLQAIANDASRPAALRLKALDAMQARKMTPEIFAMLQTLLTSADSAAARIQAATMLSGASLTAEQTSALTPAFATVGPIELKELLPLVRKTRDAEAARAAATALAGNAALVSHQESLYRTAFSSHPPELFEKIILPARRTAELAIDAKKRLIGPLAEKAAKGNPAAGRQHFEAGKGTCIACHKVGASGRPIGPDLSKIGAIRTERDLIESILFPSNTLARDYEAHIIETADGQTTLGVIRSHTAEGLLVADVAGQERNLPHDQIISNTALTDSLMPMGLDMTMSEQELLDLTAWLRSLK